MSHSGTLVCRGILSHSGTQRRNILVRREVLSHSGTLCREVLSNSDGRLRKMKKNAQSHSWHDFTRRDPRVTHGMILRQHHLE